jgi:hypothetical protein
LAARLLLTALDLGILPLPPRFPGAVFADTRQDSVTPAKAGVQGPQARYLLPLDSGLRRMTTARKKVLDSVTLLG